MAIYFVEGKLGAGKSIISVSRIADYLQRGRAVATNLDLDVSSLLSPFNKDAQVIRLPDKPRVEDMEAIGSPNTTYDESLNGLIVLDECLTWFNSRSWNDKTRKALIDWFLHARKLGWDVIFIAQDADAIDSQAKSTMMEHRVTCKRTDKMAIPFFGAIYKFFSWGENLRLPQMHLARVVYTETDQKVDTWSCNAKKLWPAYDSKQIFINDYIAEPEESGIGGAYCYIPPWHSLGRFMIKRDKDFYMRLSNLYFKKLKTQISFVGGALSAAIVALVVTLAIKPSQADAVPLSLEKEPGTIKIDEPKFPFNALEIVSVMDIDNTAPRYYGKNFKSVRRVTVRAPEGALYDLSDLSRRGYKLREYSECYSELVRSDHTIMITCAEIEIPEESNGV